VSATRVTGL